ncbi:MAG: phosphoglucosamine mutase [Bryobacteraceae bacterium]|nr:phosphoglucosamine mutase [Bryobacteraceae bacterium]
MPRAHLLKIGVSGIRGVVGEFLTPALAAAFGQAFGTYVGGGTVVIGRDTRSTGPMLQHAVQCGLLAAGCEVVDVGVLPTPTIQMYSGATRARGGIAITASHNPPEYNALKLFNQQGLFFNNYERAELIDLWHQSAFEHAPNRAIRTVRQEFAAPKQLHMERVLRHVDVAAIRARRFRVALDAVNGAGSLMTPEFLTERLGCELTAISVDPTKPFPREAEPKPESLTEIAALVRDSGCEIGFALDPDGDRLAVIDETGTVLDNDDVLALAVEAALERLPGDVVVNLTTSSAVDDIAARFGRKVWRTPVGEANVVERIQAVKAAIGGEGSSGGIIFPAVHLCRDSYSGIAMFLGRMAATGLKISELAARLPHYHRRIGKSAYQHGQLSALMQTLEDEFPDAQQDRTDGLKLNWPGRWIHVRSSNTEPVLRYAAESKDMGELDAMWSRVKELLDRSGR